MATPEAAMDERGNFVFVKELGRGEDLGVGWGAAAAGLITIWAPPP